MKGWFDLPGIQKGDRTLDEQLLGLEKLIAEIPGKSVIDFGCAEGMILKHLKDCGASECVGYEGNIQFHQLAQKLAEGCEIHFADLNVGRDWSRQWDVVLLLAIVHKLHDPEHALRTFAGLARELVVIRLPIDSDGELAWKHGRHMKCDSRVVMPDMGFVLERDVEGPRKERVHYWRRK